MKNDFKVGDWVLTSDNANGWGSVPNVVNNKILKITKIDLQDLLNDGGRIYFNNGIKTAGKEVLRKATLNEIPIQFRPKITITKQQKEQLIKTIKEI